MSQARSSAVASVPHRPGSGPGAPWCDESSRSDQSPIIRLGGIAGLLVLLPAVAAGSITASLSRGNLRQYGFPWVVAAGALLAAACILAVRLLHEHRWGR